MKKTDAIEAIKEMPKEFHLELLIEKLVFIEKAEERIKQAEEGKRVLHNEVKELVNKW